MIESNIYELEADACAVFSEHGYSKHTIKPMLFIIRALTRLHIEQGKDRFNVDIATEYVKQQEKRYQNGQLMKYPFYFYRNTVERLAEISNLGTIIKKRHTDTPELPEYFKHLLSNMFSDEKLIPKLGGTKYRHIRAFLQWLYSRGHIDLHDVDEKVIGQYIAECSLRMVGTSLCGVRKSLKDFLLFTSNDGVLSEAMTKLFLFRIPIEKKIKPFIPQDDIAAVLNVIDRSTGRGKRDYAIILLAAVTGLRGVDIVNLTLDSFDWRNGELKVIQGKTGRALALPLTTGVGKAIREYISGARPQVESNKVFLCSQAPYGAMSSVTLNANFKNYCIKANLPKQYSFYSLRRSIATNMITSGVSVITVAQALGQHTLESTKQYISLDSKNLKECALSFSDITIGGDRL